METREGMTMNDTEKRELITLLKNPPVLRDDTKIALLYGDIIDRMELAADALEETLWRDIESAPKDGTRIMAKVDFNDSGRVEVHEIWYQDGEPYPWWGYSSRYRVNIPTHWKPLDKPE